MRGGRENRHISEHLFEPVFFLASHVSTLSGSHLHLSAAKSGINHISESRLQPNIVSVLEVDG